MSRMIYLKNLPACMHLSPSNRVPTRTKTKVYVRQKLSVKSNREGGGGGGGGGTHFVSDSMPVNTFPSHDWCTLIKGTVYTLAIFDWDVS